MNTKDLLFKDIKPGTFFANNNAEIFVKLDDLVAKKMSTGVYHSSSEFGKNTFGVSGLSVFDDQEVGELLKAGWQNGLKPSNIKSQQTLLGAIHGMLAHNHPDDPLIKTILDEIEKEIPALKELREKM